MFVRQLLRSFIARKFSSNEKVRKKREKRKVKMTKNLFFLNVNHIQPIRFMKSSILIFIAFYTVKFPVHFHFIRPIKWNKIIKILSERRPTTALYSIIVNYFSASIVHLDSFVLEQISIWKEQIFLIIFSEREERLLSRVIHSRSYSGNFMSFLTKKDINFMQETIKNSIIE